MEQFIQFFLTLAAGFTVGHLFYRMKIPGGTLVGAIVGATTLNILFAAAFVPVQAKVFAQIIAGAFIGSTVERSDLRRLRHIYKPAAVLLGTYLVLNITLGFLILFVSDLDAATAFFSSVPGGISDIPLIAADMGANAPKVAVLQFVRLVVGVGIFPGMINAVCKDEQQPATVDAPVTPHAVSENKRTAVFLVALSVSIVFGIIGMSIGFPAGALVFSLFAIIALKLIWGKVYFPPWMKRLAQVLSGTYIGCSIELSDLLELRYLVLPAVILVLGYSLNCFFSGWVLRYFHGMSRKEAMLAATPAGASDMALISMDMGVQSTDLVVLQVLRLVVVSSIFPQVIHLILRMIG
ncbi:AbrB family transcriptional regulator [Hydrogenoanaerobacterium sp.]|uniref:AbrB family transcriptional regulator n=1 Tax=Hydrogenoanaerobacterium sp. TaxID=2953763 RepID=UPI00289A33CB|nr:AbrB family transcriptional regulator [Hydrogenoanaerobacterium sp.]